MLQGFVLCRAEWGAAAAPCALSAFAALQFGVPILPSKNGNKNTSSTVAYGVGPPFPMGKVNICRAEWRTILPPLCKGRWIAEQDGGIVTRLEFCRAKKENGDTPSTASGPPSLAAARSHSRSDSRLGCHSIRSCRFATSARGRLCRGEGTT